MKAVLKFKGNLVILDYEYGLYEHVEIEIEDKLEKYWADGKAVYFLMMNAGWRDLVRNLKIGRNKNFEKAEL